MTTSSGVRRAELPPDLKFGKDRDPNQTGKEKKPVDHSKGVGSGSFIPPTEESPTYGNENEPPRRSFCKSAIAAGVAAVAVAPPVAAGIRTVLSVTEVQSSQEKFYPVASLDTLDGTPRKFMITDDKDDSWNRNANVKVGSVFLRKTGENEVVALSPVCPHALCVIEAAVKKNPKTESDESLLYCPCHAAHFDLNGVRLDGVSPRDLDILETKIENGTVYVKYEEFINGIAEKKVKT